MQLYRVSRKRGKVAVSPTQNQRLARFPMVRTACDMRQKLHRPPSQGAQTVPTTHTVHLDTLNRFNCVNRGSISWHSHHDNSHKISYPGSRTECTSLRTGVFDPMNMSGINRLNVRYNRFYKILNSSDHLLTAIRTAPTAKLNASVEPL